MTISKIRSQLVLHWLLFANGLEGEGVPLDQLLGLLEDTSPVHFDVTMDCAIAQTPMLSPSAAISVLQHLIDDGAVKGWRLNNLDGREYPLTDIADSWQAGEPMLLALTAKGRREAEAFGELFNSESGRRIRSNAWKEYLLEKSTHLTFKPVAPSFLPRDTDPIPYVSIDPGKGELELTYGPATEEFSAPRLIITESSRPQPTDVRSPDRDYTQDISGFSVSVTEFHVSYNWPAAALRWRFEGIYFNLFSQWKAARESSLSINSTMREETFRVTRSMLTAR